MKGIKMSPYLIIAIISSVLFGFTTIMQKKTSGIDSITFSMISLGASFVAVFVYWMFFTPDKQYNVSGLNYSVLAGILSGFAFLFFIIALRNLKVAPVVIINSFSAVIAVVLSVVLLEEKLSIQQMIGVAMGIGGVILVTN
jgi:uncharacterized membrane protein